MADQADRSGQKVLVVIPTTAGPIRVVSLRTIGSKGRSAVLLDGTTTQANISNSYNDFIKSPTGLINRLFDLPETPTYRLDISDRIESGSSWNLAVLAAHALKAASRGLASAIHEATHLVWATGSINAVHLSIEPVAHISDKLRKSAALFEAARAAGLEVDVFLPIGTEEDLDGDVAASLRSLRIQPAFVGRVDDLLAKLGLPALPRAATDEPGNLGRWTGNPYRGLEPYLREHSAVFFGRGKAREEAGELIRIAHARERPFLLVHGPSGAGKSSFVQAGLVGDLEASLGAEAKLAVAIITPSGATSPAAAVAAALVDMDRQHQTHADPGGPAEETAPPRQRGGRPARLLVVDQLEELFAPSVSQAERVAFADMIEKIVRSGSTYVVATIRSDALGSLDQAPALARLARDERLYRLERPNRRELVEIIASPAALAGYAFPDSGMPDELVETALASSDSLPLLQAVLFRLFELSGEAKRITARDLERLGGFEGVVGRWADEVAAGLVAGGASDAALDRVLVSLVRTDRDTGRPHARTVVYRPESEEGSILRNLAKGRLVGLFASTAGPQARLAHEVLTTHWERLAGLVRRLTTAMTLRDELEARAGVWEDRGRDEAELLRGTSRIEAAMQLKTDRLVHLEDREVDFIEMSAANAEKQEAERKRSRAVRISAVAAAVIAIAGAGILYNENRAAARRNAEIQAATNETLRLKDLNLSNAARRNAEIQAATDATFAQDLLSRGDLTGAREMASKSLFVSDSETLVPKSYNVLYHLDYLSGYYDIPLQHSGHKFQTWRLSDGTFVTITDMRLSIWSPERGILSVRDVIGEDPQVAADGSAIFIGSPFGSYKYQLETKKWTKFEIAPASSEDIDISSFAAIDKQNLVGCAEEKIYKLQLTATGASKIVREAPLEDVECSHVHALPGGRVFVRDLRGATEYDPNTLQPIGHYVSSGNEGSPPALAGNLIVMEDYLLRPALYGKADPNPIYQAKSRADVSPSGRYVVYRVNNSQSDNSNGLTYEIYETSGSNNVARFTCACTVRGFSSKDEVVTSGDRTLSLVNPNSGERTALGSLPSEIEHAVVLPGNGAVLAFGRMGAARYLSLASRNTGVARIATGNPNMRRLAYLGASKILTASAPVRADVLQSEKITLKAFDRVNGAYRETWSLDTVYPDFADLRRLSPDRVVLSYQDRSFQSHIALVQVGKGIVKEEVALSKPHLDADTNEVVYETTDGLRAISAGHPDGRVLFEVDRSRMLAWSANGSVVVGVNGERIVSMDLRSPDGARTAVSKNQPVHVCRSSNRVWTIEWVPKEDHEKPLFTLWRRDAALGDATKMVDLASTDEDDPLSLKNLALSIEDPHDQKAKRFTCSDAGAFWTEAGTTPIAIFEEGSARTSSASADEHVFASEDGTVLDAGEDGRIKLYAGDTAMPSFVVPSGNSSVSSLVYNKSRNMIVAGFENGRIKAWEVGGSIEPFLDMSTVFAKIQQVAVNDDGTEIAAIGTNGSTYAWPLPYPRHLAGAGR